MGVDVSMMPSLKLTWASSVKRSCPSSCVTLTWPYKSAFPSFPGMIVARSASSESAFSFSRAQFASTLERAMVALHSEIMV